MTFLNYDINNFGFFMENLYELYTKAFHFEAKIGGFMSWGGGGGLHETFQYRNFSAATPRIIVVTG